MSNLSLRKYLAQDSISEKDIQEIRKEVYSIIARAVSSTQPDTIIGTQQELYEELERIKPDSKVTTEEWLKAYIASVKWMEEKLDFLFSLLQPGERLRLASHDIILTELEAAAFFPMKHATFLHENAEAQLEVVAQELRRALCPSDLLGRNPFPKLRLALLNTFNRQKFQVIPDVPDTYIISEKINFEHEIYLSRGEEDRDLFFIPTSPSDDLSTPTEEMKKKEVNLLPISEIPGLGTVCFFAKFLGDIDAKISNIGISADPASSTPYVFTALDSGLCFGRNPKRTAIFADHHEIIDNPHTYSNYSFHFFFSRSSFKPITTYEKYLLAISQHPQVMRENYTCAFNLAFTPPMAYEVFLKQYLTRENPYVSDYIWKRIYEDHLLKEQSALYTQFETNESYLRFFLESQDSHLNLFYRYQVLVEQIESFCFYEKKIFRELDEFQEKPGMLKDYFLEFLMRKYQGDIAFKELIDKAFRAWNPSAMVSSIDATITTERGLKLKQKVGVVLGFISPTPSLIKTGQYYVYM